MTIEYFEVGGCVRDRFMGNHKPKDIDYTVVAPSYEAMKADIEKRADKIFLEKPEYQTIRAKVAGVDADFVLARKDGAYSDGRRPDSVEPGTIFDDLARRDFTMNAIAQSVTGDIIDPFNGRDDIATRLIRTVGNPYDRFSEDALRMLRAVRFAVTKSFYLHVGVHACLHDWTLLEKLESVSAERIREELNKCFAHSTQDTLDMLESYRDLRKVVFRTGISLEVSLRKRD
jgi:tRNA nucleotidyltransferase (CCA-adding enzyme)